MFVARTRHVKRIQLLKQLTRDPHKNLLEITSQHVTTKETRREQIGQKSA